MNPFKYGQIVTNVDFCPRPQLEKNLKEHITSGQNVLIEGERRIGKSSLIMKTASAVKDYRIVYIDIYQIKTVNDLISRITNALTSLQNQSGFFEKLVKVVSHLRPSLSIDSLTGSPSISFNTKEEMAPGNIDTLLGFIYQEHLHKKIVVIFDEFQSILNIEDHKSIIAILRSKIQFHSDMPYIFSGSVRNEMDRLFYDPDSPFFKSAIKLNIGLLDRIYFEKYIKEKFLSGKRTISEDTINRIFIETLEIPGDVQELCNALWSITEYNTVLKPDDINHALTVIFAREKEFYEYTVGILTNFQLRCLTSIANLGGKNILSGKFLKSTGILHPSSVKKAVTKLVNLKILYEYNKEYRFNNPFFRTWLIHKNY